MYDNEKIIIYIICVCQNNKKTFPVFKYAS